MDEGLNPAPDEDAGTPKKHLDRKTLFIAARTGIYKIRVNTPGI